MCTLSRSLFTATLAVSLGTVDAGIAGFHKWFQSNFREAVTLTDPWQEETFDHVALDMNQVRIAIGDDVEQYATVVFHTGTQHLSVRRMRDGR